MIWYYKIYLIEPQLIASGDKRIYCGVKYYK